jgi:glycosyltransferase involved in cell wall biosynthesis
VHGVVTHSQKSYFATIQKIKPKARVFIAPLGSTRWREFKEFDEIKNKFLIFGRLNSYKGVELIPSIAHEIGRICPQVRIVVAGKVAEEIKKPIIDEIYACANVDFINEFIPEADIDNYFYDCDAVLITHTSITQSGVILDAYSHGKPIVAFRIDGIDEFMTNLGLCVPAFDVADYAEKACRLIRDTVSLREQSRVSWEYGKQRFSSDMMAKGFCRIYSEVNVNCF